MLKVLFAGTPDVAVPSLKTLATDTEHFDVVAVLTRPDAPTGRGRKLSPSPVKVAAQELGIPVIESDPKDEGFIEQLQATGAQAAAVVAYGKILKEPVLEAMPMGWYNLHFSLLPQWRGAAPVQRAIWAGDTVTGATVFRITKGMDCGPILAQSTVTVGAHETAGELLNRLAEDGSHLLAASLEAMNEGRIALQEQPQGAYEVAKKITVDDAHLRFDVPVFAVDRQARACTPNPGAWCLLHVDGAADASSESSQSSEDSAKKPMTLHVLKARPLAADDRENFERMVADREGSRLPAGQLLVTKHKVWVGTNTDPLELEQVKPQGKKAMAAADWARGAHLASTAYVD